MIQFYHTLFMYQIIMELGQIFVCINLRNWPKNSQWTQTKLLTTVQRVTLTGISIFSLWNEGFLTPCLCLTTGCHLGCTGRPLGFTEKLQNLRGWELCANSSFGNAVTTFSLSSQFHVCGCVWYRLHSGKQCILGKGKRPSGKTNINNIQERWQ